MKYRCLIIGLGKIGMEYDLHLESTEYALTHARAFSVHPKFELVAGVDPLVEQQKKFRKHYKLPVYTSLEEASQKETVDVICISVPTEKHLPTVENVLKHFAPKAILCEKPLAYDCTAGNIIVESCKDSGVQLFVNYMRGSDPGVLRMASIINAIDNSERFKGTVWYSGGFMNNGSHLFFLAEMWLGSAKGSEVISSGGNLGNGDQKIDALVRFERGEVHFLCIPNNSYSFIGIDLFSGLGRLKYEGNFASWSGIGDDPIYIGHASLNHNSTVIVVDGKRCQWHVADQLAKAMNGESAAICTGIRGYQTLKAMNSVTRN